MIVAGIGVLIMYLFGSRPKPVAAPRPVLQPQSRPNRLMPSGDEATLTRKLMTITRGNKGATERSVTARKRKHLRASRVELLELLYHDDLRDRS